MSQSVLHQNTSHRAFTWRSIALGLLSTAFVCAAAPFNDIVLSDTSLAAGYFPLASVLVMFVMIVCLNAPLHRWAPRRALGSGELAVITMMTLIACSLPNWGMMRFLVPSPVVPFFLGRDDSNFWKQFLAMDLPRGLFAVEDVEKGTSSTVMSWFYAGRPDGEAIPWQAWLKPALTWGIFVAAMLATLVALARLIFPQWSQNERLPFPLVQVQAALIESPARGRALNEVFRSRSLWIAMGLVLLIHGLTCLHAYQPKYAPGISLGYNFERIFADSFLVDLRSKVKASTLSFIIVGVTYFIRSRAAMSLWGIYLLLSVYELIQTRRGAAPTSAMWADQHMGACAAFVIGMLWIGRAHWLRVLRNAFGRSEETVYRRSFWIMVLGIATMLGWLVWAGATWWVACVIIAIILGAHVITSRVVAETGLPYFRSSMSTMQIITNLPTSSVRAADVYFAGTMNLIGPVSNRDGSMGLTMHGIGVADSQVDIDKTRFKLGGTIALTLVVGAIIAAAVTIWCHYTYPTPLARDVVPQGNNFGAVYAPDRDMGDYVIAHGAGSYPATNHNSAIQIGIGFTIVAVLEVLALNVAWWPLLPIGFVASYGAFIGNAWFSIFVGWLVKLLIVTFGGAPLFKTARPFFIGLIFGESLAAAGWLIINAIVVLNGGQSQRVSFML